MTWRRTTGIAVGGYLLARVFSALLMWWVGTHAGRVVGGGGRVLLQDRGGYWSTVASWDAGWYERIATTGYPHTLPLTQNGTVAPNQWAFAPIYPRLVGGVMDLTGGSFAVVGGTLSLLFGALAAALMVPLLAPRIGPRATWMTVLIWAVSPASPVLQMAYAESLAVVFVVACLLALDRRQWLLGGVLIAGCALVRPVAAPLVVTLAVAFVARWLAARRTATGIDGRERVWAAVGFAIACAGQVIWPVVAWLGTGDRAAYTKTEAAWRPHGRLVPLAGWFTGAERLAGPVGVVLGVAFIAWVCAAVFGPSTRRLGPALRAWCLVYPAYIVATTESFTSQVRFALLVFPVGAVFIGAASPGPARRMTTRFVVVFAMMLVLQVMWCWRILWYPDSVGAV